jgi:hypothetical protein
LESLVISAIHKNVIHTTSVIQLGMVVTEALKTEIMRNQTQHKYCPLSLASKHTMKILVLMHLSPSSPWNFKICSA